MATKNEIVSFNAEVPEMSKLLEIDGAELDSVTGGVAKEPDCPNLTSCTTYTQCTIKASL
jgi:hypothetical protein